MAEIRRGISRTCILVGRWAIKVPTTRPYGRRGDRLYAWTRGYQANHSELAWSGTRGTCPVIWNIGSMVVCYRRCDPVTEDDHLPDPDDETGRQWWDALSDMSFGDRKASNLGWLDGALVWIDFDGSWNGCPHSREVYAYADE